MRTGRRRMRYGRAMMVVGALVVSNACAPDAAPAGNGPDEGVIEVHPPSASPIDWLFGGEGFEALAAVPGSTWTAETGVEVAAVCSPTDAHEGWTVSASLIPSGETPAAFDPGGAFAVLGGDGPRAWEHVADSRLRLVERDDGRIELEYFIPLGQAPVWEAIDQREVEVVFSPDRCG